MVAAIDDSASQNRHTPYWARLRQHAQSNGLIPDAEGAPPTSPQHAPNNLASHLARVSSLAHAPSHDVVHERHVMDYLTNHVTPQSNVREPPPFSRDDVSQACLHSRLNTALGSDNVSPQFLKYGGDTVQKSLYMLFSILSCHGLCPFSFRHGHVVMIYKGDGKVQIAPVNSMGPTVSIMVRHPPLLSQSDPTTPLPLPLLPTRFGEIPNQ